MPMDTQVKTGAKVLVTIAPHLVGHEELAALLNQLGYKGQVRGRDLDAVAALLIPFAPPGKPVNWQRKYLDNIIHDRQAASPALLDAVQRLRAERAGTPDIIARAQPVDCITAASVKPGSLVKRDSRDCVICQRPFIPTVWNDWYCSPEHRQEARRRKAQEASHKTPR